MRLFIQWLFAATLTLTMIASASGEAQHGPVVTGRVQPDYPNKAEKAKISGTVEAVLTVRPDGTVKQVTIKSETPEGYGLAVAATKALWQWSFEPGRPGEFSVTTDFRPRHPYTPAEMAALPPLPGPPPVPRYPSRALREGLNGTVEAVVVLDKSGAVQNVEIVSERPVNHRFAYAAAVAFEGQFFPKAPAGAYRAKVMFDHAVAPAEARPNRSKIVAYKCPLTVFVPVKISVKRKSKIVGAVELLVQVNDMGRVKAIDVVREDPNEKDWTIDAIEAAENHEFGPGEAVTYAITVNFLRP